ncbi:MAG: hypothetical protein MUF31_06565 [Akkermansiaceae bacterium]|nr:hypothetical protein [Akkermansiaceae bacterium]
MLLRSIRPTTPSGADLLLDLRDLLMSRGHAGKCVKCFFGLLGDLGQPGALVPLRHWLEKHVEIEVRADGKRLETLPVQLGRSADLHAYCEEVIRRLREDRAYTQQRLDLRFRFRESAEAGALGSGA